MWFAILEDDVRFGSQHLEVSAIEGDRYRYDHTLRILLDPFASHPQEIRVVGEYVVTADLRPVSMLVETEHVVGRSRVEGKLEGSEFVFTVSSGGEQQPTRVPVGPEKAVLFPVCLEDWLAGLDPTIESAPATILDEEPYEVVARRSTSSATETEWLLDYGEQYGMASLTLGADGLTVRGFEEESNQSVVRCTPEEAQDLEHRVMQGAEVLSFPLDREILRPDLLEHLVVELTWRDIPFRDFRLEDGRQRLMAYSDSGQEQSARVEIAAPDSFTENVTIPVEGERFAVYLADTEYIKPSDSEIAEAARKAIGDTTDARTAVKLLSEWVRGYVKSEMIAETLSGPEVLRAGRGKCTEYSTLFASMARAAGIPTRVVLGERIAGGSWGGHMWNEAFVGRWITVDASVDEVEHSMQLLKFIHSDTVAGTQSLRQALPKSLALSIVDVGLRETQDSSTYTTGIDGVTYTHVEFGARIAAPSNDWTLKELDEPGAVAVQFISPHSAQVNFAFAAFPIPKGVKAKTIIEGRARQLWNQHFDSVELLTSKPHELHGVTGHATEVGGTMQGSEAPVRISEVCWIRGSVGYLVTMNGDAIEHAAQYPEFEALLASFQFLEPLPPPVDSDR